MSNFSINPNCPASVMKGRLASTNARHLMARVGVDVIREFGPSVCSDPMSQRGFYSKVVELGYDSICRRGLDPVLAMELDTIAAADRELFTGFGNVSRHNILGLGLSVYPGLSSLSRAGALFHEQRERAMQVASLLEQNFRTPLGDPSPVSLLEDNPEWATEQPDIRNIRGNIAGAVSQALEEAYAIEDFLLDAGALSIANVVVFGIGANDMYLKDLPMLINSDGASRRRLFSVFEPGQLSELPDELTADNTLFIAISRGGGTQETLKSMEFAYQQGRMRHLVTYANKGPVKEFAESRGGMLLGLENSIGGRYMWAKGKIVLVPLALTASREAFGQYTDAMTEFDSAFWPVGEDRTILDLASHMHLYISAYNIPGIFACSNGPVLDAGLRQFFQLHNEAVGKITNHTIAYGAGMEMLPFAHAGADGLLGAAISAQVYGAFIFDTKYEPRTQALTAQDLVGADLAHEGLTPELLRMACVFPNQAKFTYAGAPNFMITMDGVNYRNLALMTAFYQNLMYPYLIMNGTNPDSNPNVAMVRSSTSGLITGLLEQEEKPPIEVIEELVPGTMR